MKTYTLEDLTADGERNPAVKDALFRWHWNNGRWGGPAVATEYNARMSFEIDVQNQAVKAALLNAYLPVYSLERNHRNLRNGIAKAGVATAAGIAAIILGLLVDSKTAKFFLETVGTGSTTAGLVGAGATYLRYKT